MFERGKHPGSEWMSGSFLPCHKLIALDTVGVEASMTGPEGASDAELIERMRRGDETAFSVVMTRHGSAVYRYAWALADEASQAEDLTQETFLVLWKQRRKMRIVGVSALPWLLTACRFTAFNMNRRSRKERTVLVELDAVANPQGGGSLEVIDELRWIGDEIGQLSDIDQKLCQLCLIEDRSYKDAARVLGITPGAARKRIQRTREHLAAARALNDY